LEKRGPDIIGLPLHFGEKKKDVDRIREREE
jgi:hypothetical protein